MAVRSRAADPGSRTAAPPRPRQRPAAYRPGARRLVALAVATALGIPAAGHGAEWGVGALLVRPGPSLDYRRHEDGEPGASARIGPHGWGGGARVFARLAIDDATGFEAEFDRAVASGRGSARAPVRLGPFDLFAQAPATLEVARDTLQLAILRRAWGTDRMGLAIGGGVVLARLEARADAGGESLHDTLIGGLPMLAATWTVAPRDGLRLAVAVRHGRLRTPAVDARWSVAKAGLRYDAGRSLAVEGGYRYESLNLSSTRDAWSADARLPASGLFVDLVRPF